MKKIVLSGKTTQAFRPVGKFRQAASTEVVTRSVSSAFKAGDHVQVRDIGEKQSDLLDSWLQSEGSYASGAHASWLDTWKELESWESQLKRGSGVRSFFQRAWRRIVAGPGVAS